MRQISVFLILLLLLVGVGACGGGSGVAALPEGDEEPTLPTDEDDPLPPAPDAKTKALLEDCLPTAIQESIDWVEFVRQLIDGQGSGMGVAIPLGQIDVQAAATPGDPSWLNIPWSYDPNGDRQPEGLGSCAFLDDAGATVQPFAAPELDQLLLSESIDALGSILPTLADGTRLLSEFAGIGSAALVTSLDVDYADGLPGGASGAVALDVATCRTSVSWATLPLTGFLADLATTFPLGVWSFSIASGADTLAGTITMDGTRTADVTVQLNGGAAQAWGFDLVTGGAIAAP